MLRSSPSDIAVAARLVLQPPTKQPHRAGGGARARAVAAPAWIGPDPA
jgi:hypothetical protein